MLYGGASDEFCKGTSRNPRIRTCLPDYCPFFPRCLLAIFINVFYTIWNIRQAVQLGRIQTYAVKHSLFHCEWSTARIFSASNCIYFYNVKPNICIWQHVNPLILITIGPPCPQTMSCRLWLSVTGENTLLVTVYSDDTQVGLEIGEVPNMLACHRLNAIKHSMVHV
jgi:hypothetical protein